jgi:hypothetical protein
MEGVDKQDQAFLSFSLLLLPNVVSLMNRLLLNLPTHTGPPCCHEGQIIAGKTQRAKDTTD